MPCRRSPSAPRERLTSASSCMEVGHTSGHCVKPKNTTTTLPAKSFKLRCWPLWSVNGRSRAYSAPVTSMPRNSTFFSEQAEKSTVAPASKAQAATDLIAFRLFMFTSRSGPPTAQQTARSGESGKSGKSCGPGRRSNCATRQIHSRKIPRSAPRQRPGTAMNSCRTRRA